MSLSLDEFLIRLDSRNEISERFRARRRFSLSLSFFPSFFLSHSDNYAMLERERKRERDLNKEFLKHSPLLFKKLPFLFFFFHVPRTTIFVPFFFFPTLMSLLTNVSIFHSFVLSSRLQYNINRSVLFTLRQGYVRVILII